MTFVSYAQNFEDVMLWRALKHIENGFYIDIGAAWPQEHSVTKAFYDRGWHGINVEPNPAFYNELQTHRSRDVNLPLAISNHSGQMIFNLLQDTGLSTLDSDIATQHSHAGWNIDKQTVEVTTLAALWEMHVPDHQAIHFLKIDVEGSEETVLLGNNWKQNRAWIVIIEATLPLSPIETHACWESTLLSNDYNFVYADGLNRFYIANEHLELTAAFKYPPNVFDEFISSIQYTLSTQILEVEDRCKQETIRADQTAFKLKELEIINNNLNEELNILYTSRSWRITAPLRWINHQKKLIHEQRLQARFKAFLKRAACTTIGSATSKIKKNHRIYNTLKTILINLGLYHHIRTLYLKNKSHHHSFELIERVKRQEPFIDSTSFLTPRAEQIYIDLKKSIQENQEQH